MELKKLHASVCVCVCGVMISSDHALLFLPFDFSFISSLVSASQSDFFSGFFYLR